MKLLRNSFVLIIIGLLMGASPSAPIPIYFEWEAPSNHNIITEFNVFSSENNKPFKFEQSVPKIAFNDTVGGRWKTIVKENTNLKVFVTSLSVSDESEGSETSKTINIIGGGFCTPAKIDIY